jgi:polar amino acid transport system substrate-binding protein
MVALVNGSITTAIERNDPNLQTSLDNFTHGNGFDKVIITAAAQTNDPVELAGQILRKKGLVVVVGAVKMDIPREPDYYKKELELKLSCSYGPGRYDVNYEEGGIDYPYGYVRWTEQRNMEAFLQLIANKSINIKPLTTHVFDISDSVKAYDLILGKTKEPFIGILLKYPFEANSSTVEVKVNENEIRELNAGFIGAGSFAQSYLIPNFRAVGSLDSVVTRNGINSKNVAAKFGFNKAVSEPSAILDNKDINTVFIATQHDTHAQYVIESLKAGKAIFVEKPLALNISELKNIIQTYQESRNAVVMVGFNRRFADLSVIAKKEFKSIGEPLVMNFRVNAGFIPKDHWTQTSAGGGRIIGEVCHFIDLMQFFTGAEPVRVFAESIEASSSRIKNDDNVSVSVKFSDGSVGNLVYVANGDKALPKERLEIFGGNIAFVIDDFTRGSLYRDNNEKHFKAPGKGHKQEVEAFVRSIKQDGTSPIPFKSICLTTLTTFKIVESLYTGMPQDIEF